MAPTDRELSASLPSFTRRALVGSGLAAAAILRLGTSPALVPAEASSDPTTWRTWLLESVDELRPAAPSDPTQSEIDELLEYQSKRSDETTATVAHWDSGPAVIPWVELGLDLADEFGLSGPRTARAQALLRTALYDTVLATLDAQEHIRERPPPLLIRVLRPWRASRLMAHPSRRSMPLWRALRAGSPPTSSRMRRTASMRLPRKPPLPPVGRGELSQRRRGRTALGQEVGKLAEARGRADGSDATWDGSGQLKGEGIGNRPLPCSLRTSRAARRDLAALGAAEWGCRAPGAAAGVRIAPVAG